MVLSIPHNLCNSKPFVEYLWRELMNINTWECVWIITYHRSHIYNKYRKQAGIIYRNVSNSSSSSTLKRLYITFVRPHLEYAAPIWDPHCISHIDTIKSVQRFAICVSRPGGMNIYHCLNIVDCQLWQLEGNYSNSAFYINWWWVITHSLMLHWSLGTLIHGSGVLTLVIFLNVLLKLMIFYVFLFSPHYIFVELSPVIVALSFIFWL